MRPSACQSAVEQRRREIELALAYLVGPALQAQRIALDTFAAWIETAAVTRAEEPAASARTDQPAPAAPDVRLRPKRRAMLKPSDGALERSGAAASPP